MHHSRLLAGAIMAAALCFAPLSASAQEKAPASGSGQNVLITLTIVKTGGTTPRETAYKMIGQDGSEASMLIGWRTPIPTVSAARDDAGKSGSTAYVYQNVGVKARLAIRVLSEGQIHLDGDVEISGARENVSTQPGEQKPPLIGTFQQSLKAVVNQGKKLRVAEGPDPEGGSLALDIEAAVLR